MGNTGFSISSKLNELLSEQEIKWKNKIYHTAGTVLKSNRKIVEMGKSDTLNTYVWPLTVKVWDRHVDKKWRCQT